MTKVLCYASNMLRPKRSISLYVLQPFMVKTFSRSEKWVIKINSERRCSATYGNISQKSAKICFFVAFYSSYFHSCAIRCVCVMIDSLKNFSLKYSINQWQLFSKVVKQWKNHLSLILTQHPFSPVTILNAILSNWIFSNTKTLWVVFNSVPKRFNQPLIIYE